ncbi:7,8 dihydropteroate synthase (methanopterin) [Methanosarcina siciliae C2J]|uniref:7,8 dihydropteroate synthase (Methanopterin) n=1 Tax=Methanosarcina siciliae C2J TaxID=1434118 RepID=A0A0E3PMQ7_9EURY|nr:MBL fold metallo-hydrolase [Methanosarcina siciliae]AKB36795.1 7,8 dihydropteroate synthase (methanopterin) [Methanosarcina siciliae C2J]
MKLTVLVDNNTLIDRYFFAEPGLSFLLEDSGTRVLFDTGYSDIFLKNARKMGLSLLDLDYLVLSHGHLDHSWGLEPLIRLFTEAGIERLPGRSPILVAHPLAFESKKIEGIGEIGSLFTPKKLSEHFRLQLSSTPFWLSERLVFLGEIPRNFAFEAGAAVGYVKDSEGNKIPDLLRDDTALVYRAEAGLVIITGCSHSGICNITEYAKEVCGDSRVLDIVGGFHLLEPSEERMSGTLEYLKKLDPECIHACHCTDLNSKIELSKVCRLKEVGVGLQLEYF